MDHFENIKAWPFVEAKKLLEKIDKIEDNEPVVFETGMVLQDFLILVHLVKLPELSW